MDILIVLVVIILLIIVFQLHNLDKTLCSAMLTHKQTGRAVLRVQETSVEEMANTLWEYRQTKTPSSIKGWELLGVKGIMKLRW